MSAEFTFKTGDTYPNLVAILSNQLGVINLTTAEHVKLIIKKEATVKEGSCTVIGATEGKVEFDWESTDTETAGAWQAEFKITWSAGEIESVPSATYNAIEFIPSL